jgi:hypothetical protein
MVGPVLDLVDVADPIDGFDRLPVRLIGAVLLVTGGGLGVLAQVQTGASWRAGIDVSGRYELVCDGLFRVMRNPFYLGIILAAAGVALMVPNVVAVIGWLAVVLGCEIDVRLVEEPHLAAAKGPLPGVRGDYGPTPSTRRSGHEVVTSVALRARVKTTRCKH